MVHAVCVVDLLCRVTTVTKFDSWAAGCARFEKVPEDVLRDIIDTSLYSIIT